MEQIFTNPPALNQEKEPAYPKPVAENLTSQVQVAMGDPSEEGFKITYNQIQDGYETIIRQNIADLRQIEQQGLQREVLDMSLKNGDVDTAYGIVSGAVPPENPNTALEKGFVERSAAIKAFNDKEPRVDDAFDYKRNAVLVATNNVIEKSVSEMQRKYGTSLEYIGYLLDGDFTLDDHPITFTAKKAYHAFQSSPNVVQGIFEAGSTVKEVTKHAINFAQDVLGLILPIIGGSHYSWGKTHSGPSAMSVLEFFDPGGNSKGLADIINDPNTPVEEAVELINREYDNYIRSFYTNLTTNPLKVFAAVLEMLSMDQASVAPFDKDANPEYLKRLETKNVIEKGVVQPNLLRQFANPLEEPANPDSLSSSMWRAFTNTLTALGMNRYVETAVDQPLLDAFFLARAVKTYKITRAVAGSRPAATLVNANLYNGSKDIGAMLHATQLAHPGSIVDPTLLAEVDALRATAERGISNIVAGERTTLGAAEYAQAESALRATEFRGQDLGWMAPRVEGSNHFMDVYLQAQSGMPFISKQAAETEATMKGYRDFDTFQHPSNGGWYIKISRSVDETGFLPTVPSPEKSRLVDTIFRTFTLYGGRIWSPSVTIEKELTDLGTSSGLETGKLIKAFDELHTPLRVLSKEQLMDLGEVITSAQKVPNPTASKPWQKGKWLTETELDAAYWTMKGRLPSKEEKLGYYTFRTSSDMNYILQNKRWYDTLNSRGYNHWYIPEVAEADAVIAKIVPNASHIPEDAIVRLVDGTIARKNKIIGHQWDHDNNLILKVHGQYEINGKKVSYIQAPRQGTTSSGLNKFILDYTEGGTRNYVGSRFVKINRNDNTPVTLAAFISESAANTYRAKVERVQDIYRNFEAARLQLQASGMLNQHSLAILRNQYDNLLQQVHSRFTTTKIERDLKAGKFSLDDKPFVNYDRMDTPRTAKSRSIKDPEVYQSKGRLYYSERGEFLTSDIDDMAELENPFAALSRQQGHAARAAGYSEFAVGRMNAWASKHKNAIDPKSVGPGASLEDIFRNGQFFERPEGYTEQMRNRALTEREYIARILRQPTPQEQYIDAQKMKFAEQVSSLMDKPLKFIPEKYLQSLHTGKVVTETEAINALRGVAYDLHLGMFSPDQLWLQAAGSMVAGILHPIYGAEAVKDYIFLRGAGLFNFSDKVVSVLDKNMAVLGWKKGDFSKLASEFQTTGLSNIGSTDITLGQIARSKGIAGGAIDKTRQAGRVFVYEGEAFARGVAYGVARRLAQDKVRAGEFVAGSAEYYRYIQGTTNDFQLGMMAGMETAWQRWPATALMTQMLQYPFKAMEVFLGLNKRFTAAEKLKITAAMTAMFGAYGVPGGPEMVNFILRKRDQGDEVSEETVKLFYFGGLDWFMRNVLKEDTALSARFGAGDMLGYIHDAFMVNTGIETITGLAGKDLQKIYSAGKNIRIIVTTALAASAEGEPTGTYLAADVLGELGQLFSSTTKATKGLYMQYYGMRMNSKFDNITEMNSGMGALMTGLGVTSGDEQLLFISYNLGKISDSTKFSIASNLSKLEMDLALAAERKDYKRAQHILKLMDATMAPVTDPRMRNEIRRIAHSKLVTPETAEMLRNAGIVWEPQE